jgi:PleD family two-component response regulator
MSVNGKKLVLIVDDTPTNVAVVSGVLKDSFRTKVATNGEKALAIANGPEKPDLILLDVMMPGMDGYEVCRKMKDNPATRDIPVIFLTAKTEEVDEEKGFDVGAVDYIHKPFSGPIVLARVRTQLALQEALIEAQNARNQADQLLHALLPKKAADEIRSIGTVIPRRYENVAVLFCDVQFHRVLRQARAGGSRVPTRRAVRHLRAHRRQARAREDQDDRRRLHGGGRASAQG